MQRGADDRRRRARSADYRQEKQGCWVDDDGGGDEHAARCAALVRALNERVCAWRVVREDSRVKVMVALTALDEATCGLAPPFEAFPGRLKWVEIVIYITRPRAMNLPRASFHVTALVNRRRAYALVVDLRVAPSRGPGSPDVVRFCNATALPEPVNAPDPGSEEMPVAPLEYVDADAVTEPAAPPVDPFDCLPLTVGAWWSVPQRKIYYLRMEHSLLALCPAGWRARGLGAVLARLLNHERGCPTCRGACDGSDEGGAAASGGEDHADAYNAVWNPGGLALSCLCRGPCVWAKARQRDLSVEGDPSLCQVLFMDAVESVRVADPEEVGITGYLGDVIAASGTARRVPANATGWRLACLPPAWSEAMVRGCARLTATLAAGVAAREAARRR